MAARTEQARAFYRQVAHLIDLGEPCEQEAAMVKLLATEMAAEVTGDGIQLHGGNGYTTERQAERHWRGTPPTTRLQGTRPAHDDLRGNQPDPAADHRRPAAAEEPAVLTRALATCRERRSFQRAAAA